MKALSQRPAGPVFLALGFLIWASAFSMLYAALSIGCELGWNSITWGIFDLLRLILFTLWAGHMTLLAWLYRVCRKRLDTSGEENSSAARFLGRASLGATMAAVASTFWIGLAIPLSSTCG